MATLVVSDLHLGATSGADLLRRPDLREPLLAALADGVERLVILGDALELREVAVRRAASHGLPLLREAGEALGPGGEIVLLGGNHDHALLAGWTDTQLLQDPPHAMALSARVEPADAGPLGETLAEAAAAGGARLSFAYPGIWLRDDVYALHGHYLDVHTLVPTIERLAAGAMARYVSPLPDDGRATPDDYEAILAPMYSWIHALAQRSRDGVMRAGSRSSARAWVTLAGERPDGAVARVRRTTLRGAFAAAVAGANAAGLGPLSRRAHRPGAAARQPRRHGRGAAPPRCRRPARHVRAHPPGRAVAGGRPLRVDAAVGHAADQHRLLGLPAALPHRPPGRLAVLARHRDPRRRHRPPAAAEVARRPRPRGAATYSGAGVKQVARISTPSGTSSASVPAVCRSCSSTV